MANLKNPSHIEGEEIWHRGIFSTGDIPGVVFHGTDGTVARPDGFSYIIWRGNAEPDNAVDDDVWIPDNLDNQHTHPEYAESVKIQEHGADNTVVRPDAVLVLWVGSVEPNNGVADDIFQNTTDNTLYRFDGTIWQPGAVPVSGGTFTGNVTVENGFFVNISDFIRVDRISDSLGAVEFFSHTEGPAIQWRSNDYAPQRTLKYQIANDQLVLVGGIFFNDTIQKSDALGAVHQFEQDAAGVPGLVLRTLTNPTAGEPIFVVESSGNAERLRVEHDGAVSTDNPDIYAGGDSSTGKRVWQSPNGGRNIFVQSSTPNAQTSGDLWVET